MRRHLTILLILPVILFSACKKDEPAEKILDSNLSKISKALLENSELVSRVFTDTVIQLHPGVEATEIHYLSMEGYSMRIFVLEADLKQPGVELRPLTPFASTSYGRQTVAEMLKYMQTTGVKPLFGCNGDFFNANTGEPRGIVYLNGQAIRTTMPGDTWGFFGITKTGELVVGDSVDHDQRKGELQHALGGRHRLVRNKVLVPQSDQTIEPRTCVGFTEDKVVYFIVVDGRRFDYSNGATFQKLGQMMVALGVKEALNVDGGGSSSFVINNPRADILDMRNWSSDGAPRAVANGWSIVITN
jgi:Exopolysaccharide biosynthesis protein related to N-acetylglucosamine-1-phosphodiester alpha-N-acetylglucosaminidase